MANILIVDDSLFMRKTLSDILVDAGHEVVGEAENAVEAASMYDKLKPDLVTMDIVMPIIEGSDAISVLREMTAAAPPAKVVMISALGQEEVVKECLHLGAKDFIVKPFKPSDVTRVVTEALESD